MCRADIFGILIFVARSDHNCDAAIVGVIDTIFQILVMRVAAETEVDHLCSLADSIPDPVADYGGTALAGGVHDTDRQDINFNPGCAVHDSSGDMSPVAVLIRRSIIIIDQIDSGKYSSVHFLMVGHAAVHNGHLDRSCRIALYVSGVFIRLQRGNSPGHGS